MDVRNKRVLVVGLGKSGFAAAQLLKTAGAEVFVTEKSCDEEVKRRALSLRKRKIKVEIEGHSGYFLKGVELAVISPGISFDEPFVKKEILAKGIPVISEVELAFGFCPSRKLIAVTGTNGKSTTVELIGHILRKTGRKVVVCGNIGRPFSACVKKIDAETIVVVEISSYQLEAIEKFRPYISVILNVTEDHLDRYDSMDDYALAKAEIFKNQTEKDFCIVNSDDTNTERFLPHIEAGVKTFSLLDKKACCFLDEDKIVLRNNKKNKTICRLKDLPFSGKHNVENTLAGVVAVSFFIKDLDVLSAAISDFKPLEHRMQLVTRICGIDFIDDSKATNIDATKRALEALDKSVILICGGRNKKNDFGKVKEAVCDKVKLAIAIGESRSEIARVFKGFINTEFAGSLSEATRMAFGRAVRGDCILLSPMCASFDMFRDYKERGACFKRCVLEIKKEVECVQKG